ncbi:hypothetical protein MHYP_G00335540 [Metynnis hypsauchen]
MASPPPLLHDLANIFFNEISKGGEVMGVEHSEGKRNYDTDTLCSCQSTAFVNKKNPKQNKQTGYTWNLISR